MQNLGKRLYELFCLKIDAMCQFLGTLAFSTSLFLGLCFNASLQAQEERLNLNPPLDKGYLTQQTQIIDSGEGPARFIFNNKKVRNKLLGDVRKARVYIQLLAYRKDTTEFLFKAQRRLRTYGRLIGSEIAHLAGVEKDPRQVLIDQAPTKLLNAVVNVYPPGTFQDMYTQYINRLNRGTEFERDPTFTLEPFWRLVLEEAFNSAYRTIESARVQETLEDAKYALSEKDENLVRQAFCTRKPAGNNSPLLIHYASASLTPPLRSRAIQNAILTEAFEPSSSPSNFFGERMLSMPISYSDKVKDPLAYDILKDLNKLRPFPGKEEGVLSNVIVAFGLAELVRNGYVKDWDKSRDGLRSYLICKKWDEEILPNVEKISNLLPIKFAFYDAILTAIHFNIEALYYLFQLSDGNILDWTFGNSFDDLESDPSNPDEVIDKFIFLHGFYKNPVLQTHIQKTYHLFYPESQLVELHNKLDELFETKQEKLKKSKNEAVAISVLVIGSFMIGGIWVEAPRVLITYFIIDAIVLGSKYLSQMFHQGGVAQVTKALYFNLEPDWHYSIDRKSIENTIILDEEATSDMYWISFSLLMGGGMIGTRMGIKLYRSVKGITKTGLLVLHRKDLYEIQYYLMQLLKVIQKRRELAKTYELIVSRGKEFQKVYRYFPGHLIERYFPKVAEELKKLGFTPEMTLNERKALLPKIFPRDEVPKISEHCTLWEIAIRLGLVTEKTEEATATLVRLAETDLVTQKAAELFHQFDTSILGADKAIEIFSSLRRQDDVIPILKQNFDLIRVRSRKIWEALDKIDDQTEDIKYQIRHARNIGELSMEASTQLKLLGFDNTTSYRIRNTAAFLFKWHRKGRTGAELIWRFHQWLKFGERFLPWSAVKDTALGKFVRQAMEKTHLASIFRRTSKSVQDSFVGRGGKKLMAFWREEIEFKNADRWAVDFFKRYKIGVDRRIISTLLHQTTKDIPMVASGDRVAKWMASDTDIISLDELDNTLLNLSVAFVNIATRKFIATSHITLGDKIRRALYTHLFTNMAVATAFNFKGLEIDFKKVLDFESPFNLDCLQEIIRRGQFGGIYYTGFAFIRDYHLVYRLRYLMHNPSFGGTSKTYGKANLILAISLIDKGGGGGILSWTQDEPFGIPVHARADCEVEKEQFKGSLEDLYLIPEEERAQISALQKRISGSLYNNMRIRTINSFSRKELEAEIQALENFYKDGTLPESWFDG